MLKVVATQLCHHVEDNNLNEVYQSTYKQYHCAETVSIKVQGPVDLYSFIQKSFWINFLCLLRISNKEQPFFCLDQLSITLICVPSYDLSYNVYLFPYWFEIGYFSVTTRI